MAYSEKEVKKQPCIYSWDCMINYDGNEDENKKIDNIDTAKIDLDLEMDANIVNKKVFQ